MLRSIFLFDLLCFGMNSAVQAELMPTPQSTSNQLFWGKLNAYYPDEQRVVISDVSMSIDTHTQLLGINGTALADSNSQLDQNPPVVFHVYPLTDGYRVIDVQLISEADFDQLESQTGARF